MATGGFWFVSTLIDVEATLPAEMAPSIRLQRATDAQIRCVKDAYPALGFFGDPIEVGRENDWSYTAGAASQGVRLPRDRWRYFTLSFSGDGREPLLVKKLFLLGDPPCTCRLNFVTTDPYGEGQVVGWAAEHYSHTQSFRLMPPRIVTENTIRQIRDAHRGIARIATDYPEIPRAIDMLNDLRMVPNHSPLYVLGLFAIIESLLTHNPNDKEIGDSLTHQVSTKIPLLDKRLPEPIDYGLFPLAPAALWKKLYAFRSRIAHGGDVNFQSGDLKALVHMDQVRVFVQTVCQKLLRYAIAEPALFRDLKAV